VADCTVMHATTITLVPHTHWDREWYEPFSVFSSRLVSMMDTLIALGDEGFPHFHLDGQTAMIDDYLAQRPERLADIERLAASGQLSVGPWVTQMDEFLTSGESHIRNLEMGRARAGALAGDQALDIGYMPDQFGHIGQMPQILQMGGLDSAMVWRGVPEEIDRTTFWWESPDGSRVLTEYMVFGYFNGANFNDRVEPAALAEDMKRSVERLRPFLAGDRMVVMVGYDHAGPDASLPTRLAAAEALAPDIQASIAGIAAHVHAEPVDDLPVWRGELRSSARAHLLPNVYSARVTQKRERGRVESLIERYAEPLVAQVPGFDDVQPELDHAWTMLLWNGAHDSACGCSHDQVAVDVDARFASARATAEDLVERALTSFGTRLADAGLVRFNPSPFEREGVPANGWRVVPAGREPATMPLGPSALEDGAGVRVGDVTLRWFDEPDVGDLYNFCYRDEGQRPVAPDGVTVDGHEIALSWPGLEVVLRITRREDEPFLRLEGVVHNERPDHRLRLHIELPAPVDGSLAGSPFELVTRPLVGEGSSVESASPTWPARGVVMAGRTAVYHEGVFEYEVLDRTQLVVTMLRCVGTISRETLATRPFEAGPHTLTPAAQMIGETAFNLGVDSPIARDDLLRRLERFALPLAEAPAAGGGDLPAEGSFTSIEGDAELSNIRARDGRIEVRLWNPWSDREVSARVGGVGHRLGPARIETFPA
jgi:alpha-mannosidase